MSVSVVIVAYHAGDALLRCLDSLADDAAAGVEVVVVDNGGGAELDAARERIGARIVGDGRNLGFAAGCNLGVAHASGETLVFLNPDTVVRPGAVAALAGTVDDPSVGAAMARLCLLEEPDRLNSSGTVVHLTGLAWAGDYGEPAATVDGVREIPVASGAAMAVRRAVLDEVGGFTDELFMYLEEVELGWRMRLRGYRSVVQPAADVLHDYDFGRNAPKYYLLERNRLVFVLSAYSARTLVLLAPVLVSAELGLLLLAARQGWARDKVAGWRWCVRNRRWLGDRRRRTQALRAVPDRALAAHLTPRMDPRMIALPGAARIANPLMAAYWAVLRRLL